GSLSGIYQRKIRLLLVMWLAGHGNARPFFVRGKCSDSKSSANMVKSYTGARLFNPSRDGRVLCHQQWKKRQHLKK
ncbi:MAG: hypothetical protein PVG12_12840, partial [Gammaproteobacteria bacterium]